MLATTLAERIERDGPLFFDEFMRACLYDPDGGFFTTGPLRSTEAGDFLTSPEVSPWFGRTFARFAAAETERIGGDCVFVDVGAGSGSLLAPLMAELGPGHCYAAIEVSPAARESLASILGSGDVHVEMTPLGSVRGVVIANELLDNLPAAVAIRRDGGWAEQQVVLSAGALTLAEAPARPSVASWCDEFAGPVVDGAIVEAQLEACQWVEETLGRLEAGALCVIDYGGTVDELAPRRAVGTVRTYRSHHLGPDPLVAPGETDLTVDVNFTAIGAIAATCGASVEMHRQDDFLARWGLRDVMRELRQRELALAVEGDPLERLKVRSERTDVEVLMHPRGLGDYRVLVARV